MKILHVEGGAHLYGGAQQVLYLLQGLGGHGVESHLACRPGCDLARRAAPFARVHELPMGGDLDLGMIGRLRRLIETLRPDLVHLHSRIGADVMGGIAARLAGVPVVHTRRVDNPEPRWLVASKYRLHDRVIAISEGIARVLLAEGLPPDKLRVVRSAVVARDFQQPCERRRVLEALGLGHGGEGGELLLVGVIAQLIERKGHGVLLDAMPALIERFPRLRLVLFGKGPLAGRLQQRIDAEGLAEHVRLAGFRADLGQILPCLDLLVHPALMEGLGVSLLQASAAAVPIVASRVGGIPEAVRDGINGLLVPPGDVDALGRAVAALLADPALRRRLGAAGRALIEEEFSPGVMVEGNLAVYRELLS
ncbi:glycosyltransferase family 4 protein [Thiohalocapsa marina]|uniref:Glycosyltransferase family 4 protein n=1 Tax=Thiohalocapsa marina TaxID=424902 RepID=A0A5M8FS62_9GAMM|nr:glycosyltransferase [Thiohalocapsa marina]KAA6184642.1 glycosyltransferase family 4 protein [Thiohalocapsa marina]